MAKHYLNDRDFYYQMVISKGKGKLTPKAEKMLILLSERTFRKKQSSYYDYDTAMDCFQTGILHLFSNWKSFNPSKFDKALPYFTEIFKRGIADGMNIHLNKKSYNDGYFKMISIDRANEGKGIHSI